MTCPCGDPRPFEQCCAPFLAGAPAPTAERLMRSRYTAYTRGEIDYLIETHDPDSRGTTDRAATEKWARESTWLALEVLATERGGADDADGIVEFIARYRGREGDVAHHERSRFRQLDGHWYYVDGETPKAKPVRAAPKAGRNDPCPCGSGKKFKRCHGA